MNVRIIGNSTGISFAEYVESFSENERNMHRPKNSLPKISEKLGYEVFNT